MSRLATLLRELRRRRLIGSIVGYLVLAFGLLEAADLLTEVLELPDGTTRWMFWALVGAFPFACYASWRWDLTVGVEVTEPLRFRGARSVASGPSVAVLPFRDISTSRDQEYLGDGIADEITAALTSVRGLGVVSRSAAYPTPVTSSASGAARSLDADAVLQGTTSKSGDRVTISAELVGRESGERLWHGEYERGMEQLMDVQEDIARHVLNRLDPGAGGKSSPRMRVHSPNPRAYELYLEARYAWTRRHKVGLDRAIECYEQAIEVDPNYALAHAGLADVHMFRGFYHVDPPMLARANAKRAIDRVVASGQAPPEAFRAQGMMLTWYERDYHGAEAAFLRALELDQTDPTTPVMYAQLLAATGRREEAREFAERGRVLDPTSPATVGLTAVAYAINRDSERAHELTEWVVKREPMNFLSRYIGGTIYVGLGDFRRAIEEMEMAVQNSRRNPLVVAFLAQCYARAGQEAEARDVLTSLTPVPEERYPFAARAAARASLGDLAGAGQDMVRAIERHEGILFISGSAPIFDPLRAHPEHPDWMKELGLPLLEVD